MPHKMMNPQIAYVLHDNRLSIEARMLYAYLCSFDDGVPPSTYQMIRQLGERQDAILSISKRARSVWTHRGREQDHVRRRGRKVLFP